MLKLDPRNGAILGTFAVGAQSEAICFDGANIWVANQGANNVTRLNSGGAVIGTYTVETAPAGIVFDGRSIWVANSGYNTVTELEYTTGQLVGNYYPVGNSPAGVCFDGNAVVDRQQNQQQRAAAVIDRRKSSPSPRQCAVGLGRGGRPTSKQNLEKVSGHFLSRNRHLSE